MKNILTIDHIESVRKWCDERQILKYKLNHNGEINVFENVHLYDIKLFMTKLKYNLYQGIKL